VQNVRHKRPTQSRREALMTFLAAYPFEIVGVDIMGPFPISKNNNQFLVIFTDHFSKYIIMQATPDQESKTIANLLVEKIVCHHGAPTKLLTDRGKNFLSALATNVYNILKIKKLTTSAYHPQTDGVNERINRTACDMLSMYVATDQLDWDQHLPFIQFAYNSSVHAATKVSPFKILYGREPIFPTDQELKIYPGDMENLQKDAQDYVRDLINKLEEIHQVARYFNEKASQRTRTNNTSKGNKGTNV